MEPLPSMAADSSELSQGVTLTLAPDALSGAGVCALLLGPDGVPALASPLAGPLAGLLSRESPQPTDFAALLAEARGTGKAVSGTIGFIDRGMAREYEVTVMAAGEDRLLLVAQDTTLAVNMRKTLIESRQRYKDLVEVSAAFAWETDGAGHLVFVSPQGVLGYSVEDLIGHRPEELLAEAVEGEVALPFSTREPVSDAEVWLRRADGAAVCLLVSAVPLRDERGRWQGARGVCRDVTDVRERDIAIARARNRERLLSFIVRSFRDEVDPENMLAIAAATVAQGVGASGCNILRIDCAPGAPPPALAPHVFLSAAVHGRVGDEIEMTEIVSQFCAGHEVVEATLGNWNVIGAVTRYRQGVNGGLILWREVSRVPYDDDDRILLSDLAAQVGIAIEQISNHEHIVALSRTDSLTGLFNRRAFLEEMERRIARLRFEKRSAALIYADLDNFKLVNDIHGHERGDAALVAVKRILLAATRPTDLVARLGGDEFAIWMDGVDRGAAQAKAERLIAAGAELQPFSGSAARPLTMSLGVAIFRPESDETIDALLSRADSAMYEGKHDGKGGWRLAPDPA